MALIALLFDVDGTLADTEPRGHRPAYNSAFAELGLDWRWNAALYRELLWVPGGRERIAHYLSAYDPPLGDQANAVARDRDGWIRALHQRKTRHFVARLEQGLMPLRAGVARLIRSAGEAGLRIAIVTNASRATLDPFMALALGKDLARYVTTSVSGDEVEAKKPAPDLYRGACARLGCAPAQALAIEDTANGLASAHELGIPVLVTVNDDSCGQPFDDAAAVVDSLGEPGAPPVRVLRSPGLAFDYVDLDVLRAISARHAARGHGA